MGIAKTPFCIHVTNIPHDVTSEELSQIFNIHVGDIVIKPGGLFNDSEAWIKNIGNEKQTRDLASKISNIKLRGQQIECDVIQEPIYRFELCRIFKTGTCKFEKGCHFKHIMCNESDSCSDEQCRYGHSRKRQVTSNVDNDDQSQFVDIKLSILYTLCCFVI